MIVLPWIRPPRIPLPAIRKFGIYGLTLAVSHSVLFSSILVRTLATVFSGLDITINASPIYYVLYYVLEHKLGFDLGFDEGENITKPSHICCVGVWLSVTFITCCLVREIIKNGLLRTVYHKLSVCSFGSVLKVGSLLAMIFHYEIWMFSYIYNIYVTTFDWPFKLIMICPFFTLLLHTSLQMVFLSYGECIHDKARYSYFVKYYIITSLFFNITMVIHVFCMGITSYFRGFQESDNVPYIILLAAVEVCYRWYAMKEHSYLRSVHSDVGKHSGGKLHSESQGAHSGQSVSFESTTFSPNDLSPEMVTGVTLRATGGSLSYYVVPLFAISLCLCVSSLGVAMAMDNPNINS